MSADAWLTYKASDTVRDAVLGLHDASLASFAISKPQREALEAIARARQTGVLRSELAKQLGAEAKNFHYVVRALETRGLITAQNINVKTPNTLGRITTNILHLPRFKLRVQPGLIKEEETGDFVLEDEETEAMRICSAIEAAPHGIALETDLKKALGYVGNKGHKRWRRYKKKLVDSGSLSNFVGEHDGGYHEFLKLEQAPSTAEGPSGGKEEEEEAETMEGNLETVAELGFDEQIINLVLEAGTAGVPKHILAARLGTTNKKVHKMMALISKRVGIHETDEQQGRMILKVWRAPDELLAQHRSTYNPPVPQGGWQAAVSAAAAARGDEDTQSAALVSQPSFQGMLTSVPVIQAAPLGSRSVSELAQSGTADAPAPFEFPELPQAPSAPDLAAATTGSTGPLSMPALPAEPVASQPAVGQLSGWELGSAAPAAAASSGATVDADIGMPAIEQEGPSQLVQNGTIQVLGIMDPAHLKMKVSTLTLQRQQRLVDRVNRDRFMLVSEAAAFFQETEAGMNMGQMDQRTRCRIVDRCLATGQLQRLLIQLPGKRIRHKGFYEEVLARADLKLDSTFLLEVKDYTHRKRAERHLKGNIKGRVAKLRAQGMDLPVMDGVVPKGPSSERPKMTQGTNNFARYNKDMDVLTANGFIRARMVRVRLLHYLVCRLVGLGGSERSGADLIHGNGQPNEALESVRESMEEDLHMAFHTQLIQVKELAGLRSQQHPESNGTAGDVALREGSRFTLKGLWDALPMTFFFQVVGCTIAKAEAESLCNEDKRMGDLDSGIQKKLSSSAACKRLQEALDTLCRMGLVEKESRPDQAAQGREQPVSTGVVYTAQPSALLELPASMAQEGDLASDAGQAGGPRVSHDYNLTQKDKLDEYWARLEYASLNNPVAVRYCWPAKRAPEVVSPAGWQMLRLMSLAQHHQLHERLAAEVDRGLNWVACRKIATDLKLSYTQVMRLAAQFRSKERVERLKMGAQPLPKLLNTTLGTLRMGRVQAQGTRKPRGRMPKRGGTKGKRATTLTQDSRDERIAQQPHPAVRMPVIPAAEEFDEVLPQQKKPRAPRGAYRPRKVTLTLEEDRTLLSTWVRWHGMHGIGPGKVCFRGSRRKLPGYHLLEVQASRRISRLSNHSKTKDNMNRLLMLAGEVHARVAARAAADQTAADVQATASNGDADASATAAPEALAEARDQPPGEGVAEAVAAPERKPKGVRKGTRRKPRHADPGEVLSKGAAVGEIVRRLADGETAPADETVYAPPRKKRPRAAAPAAPPIAKTNGSEQKKGPRMEDVFKARWAAIAEAMQEGPLFKVVTPEDALALTEAEQLLEDVLANAPSQTKMDAPPRRRRIREPGTPFLDGAPHMPRERRTGSKRKADKNAAPAVKVKRQRRRVATATQLATAEAGPDQAMMQLSTASIKGRNLVQQWRSAIGRSALNKHLAMPAGSKPPSTSVAVAMELIKSLLLVAEAAPQETPTPDAATALVRRFSQAEITEAFGYLRKAGHVNHGASNRPFHLSDAFKDSMQVADFPPEIFVEAHAARERLSKARLLHAQPEDSPESAGVDYEADEEVPSGMVAEALSLMAVGTVDIKLPDVTVEPVEAADGQDTMLGPLSWRMPLRISRGPPPLSTPCPPSPAAPPVIPTAQHMHSLNPMQQTAEEPESQQQQAQSTTGERLGGVSAEQRQDRLYQATAVAASEELRAAAEAACMEDWAARSGNPPADVALLKDALRLVRDAGPDGLTLQQLCSSTPASHDKAEELLAALLRFGLIQRIGGYLAWSYVASEHSWRFLADGAGAQGLSAGAMQPPAEASGSAHAGSQPVQAASMGTMHEPVQATGAASASAAASGTSRPPRKKPTAAATPRDLRPAAAARNGRGSADRGASQQAQQIDSRGGGREDVGAATGSQREPAGDKGEGTLLQPWSDHHGRLNEPFLRSLTQRAVSIVIRHPGIPEDLLVNELGALSPHSARRLLAMLLSGGLISARSAEAAAAPQPPAIFRRARQHPPPERKVVRHFFPNLACCFGCTAGALPALDIQKA
ncbi:hypothetical protein COCOBI_05-6470 [Coccomyxa sp. Obi]|nr:hypothetical protein COCOBI_05-6470 [Coccomyxa sp. Obi]